MVALARGGQSSAASPTLDAWIARPGGFLAAPYALAFTIHDISTDELRASPVQVYPPSSRHAVDLTADRVFTGRYAAAWTVPGGEALGAHEIRWYATLTNGGPEVVWREEFDVLAGVAGLGQGGYALVSDVRAEGLVEADATDARIQVLIAKWSAMVDRWCGQHFEPRWAELELYGSGTTSLRTGSPIIALDSVTYDGDISPILAGDMRVFNRHLRGLVDPDDRANPRIEFASNASSMPPGWCARWRKGALVRVNGIFGYTEPDGSFVGAPPPLIREAVKLLVLRDAPRRVTDAEASFEARNKYRLQSERTREQSYTLGPARGSGSGSNGSGSGGSDGPSGDPEIDSLIELYMRPMAIASA